MESITRFFSNVESESECSRRSMNVFSSNFVNGCARKRASSDSLEVFGRGGAGGLDPSFPC